MRIDSDANWSQPQDGETEGANAFESGANGTEENPPTVPEEKEASSSSSSSSSSGSDSDHDGDNKENEKGDKTEKKDPSTAVADATAGAPVPAEAGGPRDDDTDAESMVPSNVRDSIELAGGRRNDEGTDTEGGVDVDQLRGNLPRSPRRVNTKTIDEDVVFPPRGAKKKSGAKTDGDQTATETEGGAAALSDAPPTVVPAKIPKKRAARPSIDNLNPATDSGAESSEITAVVRPVVPPKRKKKPAVPKKATKITTPTVPGLEPENSEDKSGKEERSGSGSGAAAKPAETPSVAPSEAGAPLPKATSSENLKGGPPSPLRKKSSIFGFVARLGSVLKTGGSKNNTPGNSAPNSPLATPTKAPDSAKTPQTPSTITAAPATTAPLTVEEILQQKPEIDSSEELLGSDEDAPRPIGARRGGKHSFKRRAKKEPVSGTAATVRVALGSSGGAPVPGPSTSTTSVTTEPAAPVSPRGRDPKDLPVLPPKASGATLAVAPPISPRTKPTNTDNDDSSSQSSSTAEAKKTRSEADSKKLDEVKAEVNVLRADFSLKLTEVTTQRELLKDEVAHLKSHIADLKQQLDSKTAVIAEKDKTIENVRKENANAAPRRSGSAVASQETSLLEAQLRREIEQREMAEKKALEYMNQFLSMTSIMKQRSDKDSELVNKVLSLENELERLRRQLAAASAASGSPSANGAVAAANASFEFDFAKERKAFEDLFAQGRRELLDVIERGKSSLNAAAGGDDSEPPTDNEKIDIPLRKKKRAPKPGRAGRASSVSDNDSGSAVAPPPSSPGLQRVASISVNETAMKIELDQLRKENSTLKQSNTELTSRLSTLQRRNSVTLPGTVVGPPIPVNRAQPTPTGGPASPTVPRGPAAADAPSSESDRSGSPAPFLRANSMTSPRNLSGSSQEMSALNSPTSDETGPQMSLGKKSKKLKSVRFHGDVSSDEQTGKGPSWRDNVRKTLGIPKKKASPQQGPSPWRKPPEAGTGVPVAMKKPNKVDWTRSEQSYWSDDVDSDTYGPGGATSGNESNPPEFPVHRQADDSDFSEGEYGGGSDGGSASGGSLPRQAVMNTMRDGN